MASTSSEGTSSLATRSLGKLMAGGVIVGELAVGSGSITGTAPPTAGTERASGATKSGVGSAPPLSQDVKPWVVLEEARKTCVLFAPPSHSDPLRPKEGKSTI